MSKNRTKIARGFSTRVFFENSFINLSASQQVAYADKENILGN